MKICFKCHISKPLDAFYKHPMMADGHLGKCKECTKVDTKTRYVLKHDEIMAYEKKRRQSPHRKRLKRVYIKTYSEKYPEKQVAHVSLQQAVRAGKLIREPCFCGNQKSHGHHPDYSKPLEVMWLCDKHHKEEHRRMRDR